MVDFWETESDLVTKVTVALTKAFVKHPRTGWIRGDQAASAKVSEEVAVLSKQNRELKEQLDAIKDLKNLRKPAFKILLNGQEQLTLELKQLNSAVEVRGLIRELSIADIQPTLGKRIPAEEFSHYNDLVRENTQKVAEYNNKRRQNEFDRRNKTEINFSLINIGSCLANRAIAKIDPLPSIKWMQSIGDYFFYPSVSHEGHQWNAVSKALKEMGALAKNIEIREPGESLYNYMNPSDDVLVTTDPDDHSLTISFGPVLHTQKASSGNQVFLIPLVEGEFQLNVSVICEEFTEPELIHFPIKIIGHSGN